MINSTVCTLLFKEDAKIVQFSKVSSRLRPGLARTDPGFLHVSFTLVTHKSLINN